MRKLLLIGVGLFLACGAFAQTDDPYAEQKAQIREIKLSNEYFYSDVSSANPEETRDMARQLLVLAIQQEETDAMGVDTLVADSCRFIELKRIDQPRFFAYISKEAVAVWLYRKHHPGEPLPQLAAAPPVDTVPVAVPATPVAEVPADTAIAVAADTTLAALPQTAADSLQDGKPEPLAAVDSVAQRDTLAAVSADTLAQPVVTAPADTTAVQPADTVQPQPVIIRDTVRVTVRDTVRVVLRDTSRVTVTDTVRTEYEVKTSGNERLDKIIAMKTIGEVQEHFIAEKLAGRMMFGKMDSATNPENCYILIFGRDGKVAAVLDKGYDARLNFTTGESGDRIENYKGYGVIWFLLY